MVLPAKPAFECLPGEGLSHCVAANKDQRFGASHWPELAVPAKEKGLPLVEIGQK
jgi:hypothetical protein